MIPDQLGARDVVVVFTDAQGGEWTETTAAALAVRMRVASVEEVRSALVSQVQTGVLEHIQGWTFQRTDFRTRSQRRRQRRSA